MIYKTQLFKDTFIKNKNTFVLENFAKKSKIMKNKQIWPIDFAGTKLQYHWPCMTLKIFKVTNHMCWHVCKYSTSCCIFFTRFYWKELWKWCLRMPKFSLQKQRNLHRNRTGFLPLPMSHGLWGTELRNKRGWLHRSNLPWTKNLRRFNPWLQVRLVFCL